MTMTNTTVGLRLDAQTQDRLKNLGKRRDRSPHYLMKEAVQKYLESEEAVEAERDIVLSRWEHFELTGECLPHDDIKSWASSLGESSHTSDTK